MNIPVSGSDSEDSEDTTSDSHMFGSNSTSLFVR